MLIEYWPQADVDAEKIIGYYNAVAPEALPHVLADIDEALDRICDFPEVYPHQPGRPYRRHVTREYRFEIIYQAFPDRVEVIGIFRT